MSPDRLALSLIAAAALIGACTSRASDKDPPGRSASSAPAPASGSAPIPSAIASALADAGALDGGDEPAGDPLANHVETKEGLLALFSIIRPPKRDSNADGFLQKSFGTDGPSHINQGNKAFARHLVSKERCLRGLAGVTLQTAEQKAKCGAENMVPIYKKGRADKAKACIDIFEFPNKPCELPFVWVAPVQAKVICELQGKRLCSQEEWILACRGDPAGGPDQLFAYGEEMDLDACNTHKPAADFSPGCDGDSASSAWRTCSTNTEPAGSFPKCRSRFGVFDQHGNVAEIMARRDATDGLWYSQLKGSAWFYTDVARKPNERQVKGGRETYPDHCAHDPRWHVEPLREAWHVNYHLGFRCCKSVK